ncbi:MAG: hypothetical protein ACLP6G_16270 [Terriglobales bacterium]
MKTVFRSRCIKYFSGLTFFVLIFLGLMLAVGSVPLAWAGPFGVYQHGTVVRMRMGECTLSHRGFMVAFGGPAGQMPEETCPEYTLVSDKVVYVIVGRSSNQLIPLADVIDFRLHNNELAVRVDDAKHEAKFSIREMALRSEWDLVQKHITDQLSTPPHATDSAMALRNQN